MLTINGTSRDDTLHDSDHRSVIGTGAGHDTIVFGSFETDLITDFDPRADTLAFDWAEFVGNFYAVGDAPDVEFFKGGRDAAEDVGFIYNKNNGKVFFDVDGDGGFNAIKVCELAPGLRLSEDNFLYV